MKYYLKNALFGFVYLILMDLTALLISLISSKTWQFILAMVAIAFYCFVVGTIFFKEGESALDLRHSNDAQRRRMVETGEIYEIKTIPEYKPYKGFVMGAIICVPLVFVLILHLIIGLSTGGMANGAGAAAVIMYYLFFVPYAAFHSGMETFLFGEYFIVLYSIAVISATTGIAYILGARKSQRKYDIIERKHREIYGDKN